MSRQEQGRSLSILQYIQDPHPGEDYRQERAAVVQRVEYLVLRSLDSEDRAVLQRRYGLNGQMKLTIEEISQELGISAGSVYFHTEKALARLKSFYEEPDLDKPLDPIMVQGYEHSVVNSLRKSIACLSYGTRLITYEYYGIGGSPQTEEQVAKNLKLNLKDVRARIARARKQVKDDISSNHEVQRSLRALGIHRLDSDDLLRAFVEELSQFS